jgi:hypothetical protein
LGTHGADCPAHPSGFFYARQENLESAIFKHYLGFLILVPQVRILPEHHEIKGVGPHWLNPFFVSAENVSTL